MRVNATRTAGYGYKIVTRIFWYLGLIFIYTAFLRHNDYDEMDNISLTI